MRITVITVVYNDIRGLEKTIASVREQKSKTIDLEYIVIDGGSEDGTADLLFSYSKVIDLFISEKDFGIYDAMNKGIKQSTGDWLIFMNAGDVFASSDVIRNVILNIDVNANIIYGNYIISNVVKYQKLSLTFLMSHMLNHQSIFYHRSIFKIENYNLKYKFCADYAHLIKCLPEIRAHYVNKEICVYDDSGISSQDKNKYKMWLERLDAVWNSDLNINKKIYLSLRAFFALPYQYIKAKFLY